MARIHAIWSLLGGILVAAIGGTAIGLIIQPERRNSSLNEWILIALLSLGAGAALGLLSGRWFNRAPDDVATGVTSGVILRATAAETAWLIALVFYFLGLISAAALVAALVVAVVLILLFAAPSSRLIASIQEQLDRIAPGTDIAAELRSPLPRS